MTGQKRQGGREVAFLVPGDIEQLSGGYGYARALMDAWRRAGTPFSHIELPGDYPFPSARSLERTGGVLADLDPGCDVLIDGLAYGAMPEAVIKRCRAPITVLLHHPLGLETGLSGDVAEDLLSSEKTALASAEHIVVTSPETKRTIIDLFGARDEAITVAVPGLTPRPRARRDGRPPLIASIASLIPRKGHLDLVEALARLKDREWRAVFAGSKTADPEAARAIADAIERHGLGGRVELAGALAGERLDALYRDAFLFALPSYYEGYGMVFAEALSAGLPIVGYRAGAVPDVVPTGAGFLVEPGDIDTLAGSIGKVLADPSAADAMAAQALEAAKDLPGWDMTAGFIHRVLAEKTRQ